MLEDRYLWGLQSLNSIVIGVGRGQVSQSRGQTGVSRHPRARCGKQGLFGRFRTSFIVEGAANQYFIVFPCIVILHVFIVPLCLLDPTFGCMVLSDMP